MPRAGGYQVVEGLPLADPAKLVTYVQQTAVAPLTRRRGDMIFLDQHTASELRSQDGGGQGGQRGGGCSASLLHHLSSHREWVRIYVTTNYASTICVAR